MTNHLPVLIVGAGPTGLMMACELARYGVSFRIIDKKSDPTVSSNATWIQTRTIELFDHLGIADRFLKISNLCHAINFYLDGKSLVKIPLNYIDSTYPFILMLPQCETERLLNQYLEESNKKVERSLELIDVKQSDNTVISTIKYPDGHTETIPSDWLVACDGANSTVREKCNMFFPGEDLPEQFIVADAQIESFMSKDEVHVFFDKGAIFAAFPLGSNKYRISANLHLTHPRKIFAEREVIEMTQERAHGAYYVKSVSWISPFWIHSKVVKHLQDGSIFLAGDAAHIHSPAGGQGMNTGIQDAYNLAWKLALVSKGKAKPSLLNSYHPERSPVVNEIVAQTERYTKMALFDNRFLTKLQQFERRISRNPMRLSKKIGTQLTQLGIQYKNSPVIDYENISGKSLQQGTRAPDVVIDKSMRLYQYLRNSRHNVLLFTGQKSGKNTLKKIIELQKWLSQTYSDLIEIHVISKDKLNNINNIILDVNDIVHEHYHVKNPAIYIIRPDNYIAYCSKNLDSVSIERFFKRYLY